MNAFRTIVLALAVTTSALAIADTTGALGAGDAQCAEYLAKAQSPAANDIYVQSASGMIVGVIARTSQLEPAGLTMDKLARELRHYCQENPNESLFVAAAVIARPYTRAR